MNANRTKAVATLLTICGCAAADVTFTTVALTGDQAQGMPAGVTFRFLSDGRLNSGGTVLFWAELGGTGITVDNDGSIWRRDAGGLSLVLQEGAPAPGVTGSVLAAFPRAALNEAGQIAFPGVLTPASGGPVPINVGMFGSTGAGFAMIAREGGPAPGLAGNYAGFTGLALLPDGGLVWQANAGAAAWRGSVSVPPAALATTGAPAPGTGADFAYIDMPGSARSGSMLLRATTLQGTTYGMGIWVPGGSSALALTGQQVPGAPAGVLLDHLSMGPLACANDCVAFWSRVTGAGVTADTDGVVIAGSSAAPTLIAREGNPAPGTSAVYGTISPQISINASGLLLFQATLAGAGITPESNTTVYLAGPGLSQLIFREGDPAPGLPGVAFAGFGTSALNSAGEVAVIAHLRGTGVGMTNNRALYVRDRAGSLVLIVQTGSTFDPGTGPRTVEEILIESDPVTAGHGGFVDAGSAARLLLKLHFKDPGPNNTIVRASGLFTAALGGPSCYPNCDGSTVPPILNVGDFTCFLQRFAAGDAYANCDGSTQAPVLNVGDFTCFLQRFAAGCR
jgi:hypothetical protein